MHFGKLDAAERDVLLQAAILAPSMHNTQPWKFRFHGTTVEVHRDPRYELPAEDPERRMVLIGTGAAMFNIRVAVAHLGFGTTVTMQAELDGTLAAELTVDAASAGDAALADLFPFLARRRTNRGPYADRTVPIELREALVNAALAENAMLEWVTDADRRRRLLSLTADANLADATDPARTAERRHWVGGSRDRDGVPSASLGPRAIPLSAPVRDLGASRTDHSRDIGKFEAHPELAVLSTLHDSPRDWLVAGQALERVLLVATANGLATSMLTQAVEHADLRWLIRDPLSGWSEPQVVLRLGYGTEVPPTPRRPAAEFVETDVAVTTQQDVDQ
jgi:nitroreductase